MRFVEVALARRWRQGGTGQKGDGHLPGENTPPDSVPQSRWVGRGALGAPSGCLPSVSWADVTPPRSPTPSRRSGARVRQQGEGRARGGGTHVRVCRSGGVRTHRRGVSLGLIQSPSWYPQRGCGRGRVVRKPGEKSSVGRCSDSKGGVLTGPCAQTGVRSGLTARHGPPEGAVTNTASSECGDVRLIKLQRFWHRPRTRPRQGDAPAPTTSPWGAPLGCTGPVAAAQGRAGGARCAGGGGQRMESAGTSPARRLR